jgi:P-type Cu2+ transporter
VEEVAGSGLRATTEQGEERLGSAAWVGATAADQPATLWYCRDRGAPVPLHFEDALRADAGAVVSALKQAGYAVELLSGDSPAAACAAAAATGIDTVRGGVRPDGKIARLEVLKAQGHKLLMVGDGLNDAPALAAGYASMSPSTAADISQTAAGVIFQGEKLAPVVETIAVAQATRRMCVQNFSIALAYNALFVPLAMAGLVTPLLAALAMSLSSIAVTGNALRLRTMRLSLRRAPEGSP